MSKWPFLDNTVFGLIGWTLLYFLARSRYRSITALAAMAAVSGLLDEFQGQFASMRAQKPRHWMLYTLIATNGTAFATLVLLSCLLFPLDQSRHKVRVYLAAVEHGSALACLKFLSKWRVKSLQWGCVLVGNICLAAYEFYDLTATPQLLAVVLTTATILSLLVRPISHCINREYCAVLYTQDSRELALVGLLIGLRLLLELSDYYLDGPIRATFHNTETIALGIMAAYTSILFLQRAFEAQDITWKWRAFLLPAVPLGCCDVLITAVHALGAGKHNYGLNPLRVDGHNGILSVVFGIFRQFSFYGACGYLGGLLYLQLVEHHQSALLQPMDSPGQVSY